MVDSLKQVTQKYIGATDQKKKEVKMKEIRKLKDVRLKLGKKKNRQNSGFYLEQKGNSKLHFVGKKNFEKDSQMIFTIFSENRVRVERKDLYFYKYIFDMRFNFWQYQCKNF
eukprot:TRINITY_DN10386_c0_g1_i2.p2 TRINITY_DN10386_c0_g1~~TRINITY_DN10386_c0_g1_i2.p2  ORF type:complete len:112 (-),score=6.03 TRINITY_DN10386_c0_g1_i2:273-608(-)